MYEDNIKMRASLVLDAYEKQLQQIDYQGLTYAQKARFDRVASLLQNLKSIKVVDAPVLLFQAYFPLQ